MKGINQLYGAVYGAQQVYSMSLSPLQIENGTAASCHYKTSLIKVLTTFRTFYKSVKKFREPQRL
jgi:hypothetical protein